MRDVFHFPGTLAKLKRKNNGSMRKSAPASWNPEAFPYLLSAVTGRQWPQARVASVKKAQRASDGFCRLCNAESGTLEHIMSCKAITQQAAHIPRPAHFDATAAAFSDQQKRVWCTRGIGGIRIFVLLASRMDLSNGSSTCLMGTQCTKLLGTLMRH